MNRILGLVLLVQLAAVAAVYWPQDTQTPTTGALVTGLAGAGVTALHITDADGVTMELERTTEGTWTMNDALPADAGKVRLLLDALTADDPGFAIASSAGAAKRFAVDEDSFERRIEVRGDSGERTVYLGSSPSFRKIHARRDGEQEVYVLELNSYDAPTAVNSWLDRGLLAVANVDSLKLYGTDYVLDDGAWSRSDGEAVDEALMEALVQGLASLQVSGRVADGDTDADAAGEAVRLDIGAGGAMLRLAILDNPDVERYYLQSDRFDGVFDTSAYDAERLIDAARGLAGLAEQDTGTDEDAALEEPAIEEPVLEATVVEDTVPGEAPATPGYEVVREAGERPEDAER